MEVQQHDVELVPACELDDLVFAEWPQTCNTETQLRQRSRERFGEQLVIVDNPHGERGAIGLCGEAGCRHHALPTRSALAPALSPRRPRNVRTNRAPPPMRLSAQRSPPSFRAR